MISTNTTRWVPGDDQVLIECLAHEKATLHSGHVNNWKPACWRAIVVALNGSELVTQSKPKDNKACQGRWSAIKKDCAAFKFLRGLSGALWDEKTHTVTLPPDVWDSLDEDDTENTRRLLRCRNRAFPHYDAIAALVDGYDPTVANASSSVATAPAPQRNLTAVRATPIEDTSEDEGRTPAPVSPPLSLNAANSISSSSDEALDSDVDNLPPSRSYTHRQEGSGQAEDTSSLPPRKRARRSDSADQLIGSLSQLSKPLLQTPQPGPGSGLRNRPTTTNLTLAIKIAQADRLLNQAVLMEVIDLFIESPAIVEAYLALGAGLRTIWVERRVSQKLNRIIRT